MATALVFGVMFAGGVIAWYLGFRSAQFAAREQGGSVLEHLFWNRLPKGGMARRYKLWSFAAFLLAISIALLLVLPTCPWFHFL